LIVRPGSLTRRAAWRATRFAIAGCCLCAFVACSTSARRRPRVSGNGGEGLRRQHIGKPAAHAGALLIHAAHRGDRLVLQAGRDLHAGSTYLPAVQQALSARPVPGGGSRADDQPTFRARRYGYRQFSAHVRLPATSSGGGRSCRERSLDLLDGIGFSDALYDRNLSPFVQTLTAFLIHSEFRFTLIARSLSSGEGVVTGRADQRCISAFGSLFG
jgi:hypothetical protein